MVKFDINQSIKYNLFSFTQTLLGTCYFDRTNSKRSKYVAFVCYALYFGCNTLPFNVELISVKIYSPLDHFLVRVTNLRKINLSKK